MIVRWEDTKGFGFIRSESIAQDVFVHVRDYRSSSGEAPRPGLRVTFEDVHVGGKGPRAVAVQPMSASATSKGRTEGARASSPPRKQPGRPNPRAPDSGAQWALPLMVAYGVALTWIVWRRQVPWVVLPVSVLLNLATFFAYWRDKYAAQQRGWRVKEDVLHLWSLAGGWGGAWFAQQILRHKSVKASFRSTYWATVMIHCAAASGIWWFFRAA